VAVLQQHGHNQLVAALTVLGVASWIDTLYYHISEYFRIQPKGELYVGLYEEEVTYTFAAITLMQNFAQGAIKQISVFERSVAFTTAQLSALQGIANAKRSGLQAVANHVERRDKRYGIGSIIG
jgi:hypothetical protein